MARTYDYAEYEQQKNDDDGFIIKLSDRTITVPAPLFWPTVPPLAKDDDGLPVAPPVGHYERLLLGEDDWDAFVAGPGKGDEARAALIFGDMYRDRKGLPVGESPASPD
jgi:hypothetical protein